MEGPNKICANCPVPQVGKQCYANTIYTAGEELLTLNSDNVGQWKEQFEWLFNPNNTPSIEEAEIVDSKVDLTITKSKVSEVVSKFLGSKASGVDKRTTLST